MSSSDRIGVYPGTFDPVTNGHVDIIRRAARTVDRLVIGVAVNAGKGPLFSLDERSQMVRDEIAALGGDLAQRITVQPFDSLLVQFAADHNASCIIRGLRAVSDFEYEFQMALTNRKMAPELETMFLMPKDEFSYLSSSMVRQVAELGGDTKDFVPTPVQDALDKKLGNVK